jgi:hypothetical protein
MEDSVYEPQEDNNPKARAIYDLGPGGRHRRNTEGGTPVVFEKLKTLKDTKTSGRFQAYEDYIGSKVKFHPKPEATDRPRTRPTAHGPITESLYDILAVPVNCTAAELKTAFRQLALTNHPDKGGDPVAFDKVKTSYDILSNPKLREVYDEEGMNGVALISPEFDAGKFTQD